MEEIYLTKNQVLDLRAQGDIIVGYVDETIPLFKYGPEIAKMEYDKRILSAGVWAALIVAALYGMCYTILDNRKKRNQK